MRIRIFVCYICVLIAFALEAQQYDVPEHVGADVQGSTLKTELSDSWGVYRDSLPTDCNEIRVIPENNYSSKPSLPERLNACRKIYIATPKSNMLQYYLWGELINYLKEFDLEVVAVPTDYEVENVDEERDPDIQGGLYMYCDKFGFFSGGINDLGVVLELHKNPAPRTDFKVTCTFIDYYNLYEWSFNLTAPVTKKKYQRILAANLGQQRLFDPYSVVVGRKMLTCWTEEALKKKYDELGIEHIEGIYENITIGDQKYKLGLREIDGTYYLIYLSGADNTEDWDEGEVKATLIPTATSLMYKMDWIMPDKIVNTDSYASFRDGFMDIWVSENKSSYLKIYPVISDNGLSVSSRASSGTGFALSPDGLIVTNYHVIQGARTIKVRGINGDLGSAYTARPFVVDKNNDLAVIKIDDPDFTNLGQIPYKLKTGTSGVGEGIYVLGYPLRSTMGDEIKLTNGIVSSKTGFQGDVTSYQISAPIQPGNSGGPLFDSKGNLIGVINAKHIHAENVSYAIKGAFLQNMIDLLDRVPVMGSVSTMGRMSLAEQVAIIKNYVYIIDTE